VLELHFDDNQWYDTHMNIKQMTNVVYEGSMVKRLLRTGWQRLGDNEEGVGEHSFMTAVIAYLLAKEILSKKDTKRQVSLEKVMLMSIFHDFHEGRTGEMDKLAKFYMIRDQAKANQDIFASIDDELLTLLDEYEQRGSLDAQIVYEANIIAFGVECRLLIEKGNIHAQEWMNMNTTRLRLPESIELMHQIEKTDSQDWWKRERAEINEEFAK
jgi:putative hydrolases of HD superfamily